MALSRRRVKMADAEICQAFRVAERHFGVAYLTRIL